MIVPVAGDRRRGTSKLRVKTIASSAWVANEIDAFSPFSTYPEFVRAARRLRFAASDPPPGSVRPRARRGLPLADAGNDLPGHLRAGVSGDDGAVEGGEELNIGDVEVAPRDVLDDESARDAPENEASEGLWEVDPDEAERAHLLEQLGLDTPLCQHR